MNTERLFNIIITDLTNDRIKYEHELERIINSDIDIDDKLIVVKDLLTKINITEMNITKFSGMINNNNKN